MRKIIIVAAVGVLAGHTFAFAATPQAFNGAHGGNVTREQAVERADQIFGRADSNRDGRVTRAEAQRVHQQMSGNHRQSGGGHASRGGHGFLQGVFGKRGSVTKTQFRQQHLRLFARLDRNRDGVVAPAEHRQGQMKH